MIPKGFTLLEMLMVIAVVAALAGLSIPAYQTLFAQNDVETAMRTYTQALRRAQVLSRSMVDDSSWGVRIDVGTVTVYKGASYALRELASDESFSIPGSVRVSGVQEISFAKLTGITQIGGGTSSAGTTTLTSIRNDVRLVAINERGTVVEFLGDTPTTTVPTLTFTASPLSVVSGGSITLAWNTSDATACVASNGWSGSKNTSGSEVRSAITTPQTFVLTCTGPGDSVSAQQSVAILPPVPTPPPTVSLSAAPTTVQAGNTATLTWSSTNATLCVASESWTGTKALLGSQTIAALMQTSYFTLTCTNSGGQASARTQVTVTSPPPPPPPPPNYAPNAVDDAYYMETVQSGLTTDTLYVLQNDTDANGDSLTIVSVGVPTNGAVATIEGGNRIVLSRIPVGTVTFSYKISDGVANDSAVVTYTRTVETLECRKPSQCP